jgi:hypothetical protein
MGRASLLAWFLLGFFISYIAGSIGPALLLLGCCAGYVAGWVHAHITVIDECKRLGGFIVGERVYLCELIEPREKSPGADKTDSDPTQ